MSVQWLRMVPALTLHSPCRYGGKLPEKTAVEMILHPFLNVLNYLHQNCVAHRDIKPENVSAMGKGGRRVRGRKPEGGALCAAAEVQGVSLESFLRQSR